MYLLVAVAAQWDHVGGILAAEPFIGDMVEINERPSLTRGAHASMAVVVQSAERGPFRRCQIGDVPRRMGARARIHLAHLFYHTGDFAG